ncbi:MAG TPA: site-specific DNA-methyltransferase [Polyangia bacterium]|nr:site-specific DNA-methyltransferase [Polyangia bacterium]
MLVCADNLALLPTLAAGSLDLIYIDPPYASGNCYPGAYDDAWTDLEAYLDFLRPRLVELRRTLAAHGSLFVHLDQNAAHYVKIELDRIFGRDHFRGEIVWLKIRVKKAQAAGFPRVHDTILWYSRSDRFRYAHQHAPLDPAYIRSHYGQRDPATGRRYQLVSLIQDGAGPARRFGDRVIAPPPGKHWIWSQERIDAAFRADRIRFTRSGRPRLVRFLAEAQGNVHGDVWTDIPPVNSQAAERAGWPTQKPVALVERIVRACTQPGDLVADFFCGSGTTGVAAARLDRRYLLCDCSQAAVALARKRLGSCKPIPTLVEGARGS